MGAAVTTTTSFSRAETIASGARVATKCSMLSQIRCRCAVASPRLAVGSAEHWVALIVYVIVMLVVARVVVHLQRAQAVADEHDEDTLHLYELSDVLIGHKPLTELLQVVVDTIRATFGPRFVALLLPDEGVLAVVASAGDPTDDELADLAPPPGRPQRLATAEAPTAGGVLRVALTVAGRPVGLLALSDLTVDPHRRYLLNTYANQAAMAIERSQLREQAMRSELLEEVDRWRGALMGAVSHDLRTPLSTVKTAVSALRRPENGLTPADREELLALIENQSDRLDRLVTNLLDMTRIEAGTLELQRAACPVSELVDAALAALDATVPPERVTVDVGSDVPAVEVDQLLISQVVANLVDNALRYSPDGSPVEVRATLVGEVVELAVCDHGPGIAPEQRDRVFQMFNRVAGGGRAGLGLAIAKAFVEAHGESIRMDETPGGGASFVITLPVSPVPADAL